MRSCQEILHVFLTNFMHTQCAQERLCRHGNCEETWETLSGDLHEWIIDQILLRDYPKMRISTPFWLCKFCHFWLRITRREITRRCEYGSHFEYAKFVTSDYFWALSEIILRVLWQTIQRWLNLVSKRWKILRRARIHYECAFGQSWWGFGKNHLKSTEKRPFHFDRFSSLTTLCGDYITCNVHRILTSWGRKFPRISLAACLRKEY